MYHYRDNWFFGRRPDGSVRILHLPDHPGDGPFPEVEEEYPQAAADITVDASCWASIVSSVSLQGETGCSYHTALNFHFQE